MYSGTDRRIFRRVKGELAVKYSLNGNNKTYSTTTKNISGGGMRITLIKKLAPGTILDMEIFKYNSNISANFRGKVAWISKAPVKIKGKKKKYFEAGIKFIDLGFLYIGILINDLESRNTANPLSSRSL